MDTKNPVGKNRPPQITAPQNELHQAAAGAPETAAPATPAGPPPKEPAPGAPSATEAAASPAATPGVPSVAEAAASPAATPGAPSVTDAAASPAGFPGAAAGQIPLRHGQPLPAAALAGGAAGAGPAVAGAFPLRQWLDSEIRPTNAERQPFTADRADGLFALACFVLGFAFLRWGVGLLAGGRLFAGMQGWGVSLFCLLWGAAVLLYARAKKAAAPRASWYWLAILELCGASFALWPAGLLAPWRALLTLGAAVYFCGHLLGVPLAGKTGNFLPLDAVNMLFVVPVRNAGCAGKSFQALGGGAGGRSFARRRLLPVAAGLALCVPLLLVVVPLLASADSAGFGGLLRNISAWLREWRLWEALDRELPSIAIQLLLTAPVGVYLFGLGAGGAHKRYTRCIDAKKARQQVDALRLVPAVTVMVVLGVACAVYAVFIGCQLPYFFSAFAGAKPGQYAFYSEYAREGFFELCRIAAINLGLLAVAGIVCRRAGPNGRVPGMRLFSILLSALTVLVLATAFSKMGLYIVRHGFTPKRIMTCVFMVFLAGVCGAVVVLQFKKFSIVRFAAVSGAGLLCALCLCNLDGLVVRYNANAWQAGRLEVFDELIVARGGPAGAEKAMEVYDSLSAGADAEQKLRLEWALYHIREEARATEGTSRDSLASRTARRVIMLPAVDEMPEGLSAWGQRQWREMDDAERAQWELEQMQPAKAAFESHYAAQLERGGYE